jgi:hypothetical protein
MNNKSSMIKNMISTILFYLISIALMCFFIKIFPSGPCRFGIDDFIMFAFLITIISLFFINLYKYIRIDKTNFTSMIIHLIAIISIVIYETTL